jgi:outer membrane protein TolC
VAVARTYVQLQRGYMQLDVAEDTLKQREQIYMLTRERNLAGLDSKLELKQAESALPAARERITQLTEAIALTRNQLAALLGKGPDRGLAIARPAANALAEPAIPTNVPAELLGHRPDILAHRLRVESARHAIDSAEAEFYPNVNLLAFAGFQVLGPSSFLSLPNREYGGGAALSLPIFDAGRRRASLAGRDAEYCFGFSRGWSRVP